MEEVRAVACLEDDSVALLKRNMDVLLTERDELQREKEDLATSLQVLHCKLKRFVGMGCEC